MPALASQSLGVTTRGELGEAARAVDATLDTMQAFVRRVCGSADELAAPSTQLLCRAACRRWPRRPRR